MKINKIVRQGRLLRRMTLAELAKEGGLSKGLLSKLENDKKSNPTLSTLQKIARAFGQDVSQLLDPLDEIK